MSRSEHFKIQTQTHKRAMSQSSSYHSDTPVDDESDGGLASEKGSDDFESPKPKKKKSVKAKAKPKANGQPKAKAPKKSTVGAPKTPSKLASKPKGVPSSQVAGATPKTTQPSLKQKTPSCGSAKPKAATSNKDEPKGGIKNETEATEVVLEYMKTENRPYSAQNVFDNLRKRVNKTMCGKILDKLSDDNTLVRKEYGKNKIYSVNQDFLCGDVSESDLKAQQEELAVVNAALAEAQAETSTLQAHLSATLSAPADALLQAAISTLEAEVCEKRGRVQTLSNGVKVDPAQREKAVTNYMKYRRVWVQRKRKVEEFVAEISEGMGKKRREVEEMVGLETDEEMGMAIPEPVS